MKAVILAAGKGTRLLPLTENTPKSLVKINGVPMLNRMLKQLKDVGISEVVVIVHHLKEKVIDYCNNFQGIKVTCVEQEEMKGTADAVLCAEGHINERFLCLGVDSYFETSMLKELVSLEGNVITCVEVEETSRYGILAVNGNEVTEIVEKPNDPPSNFANMSVYIFPIEIFDACKEVVPSARGELEVTDAINSLIEKGVSFSYFKAEKILDIGTPEQLKEAEELNLA